MNTFTDKEWGVEYTEPNMFDPEEFDAHQWAAVASMAGAKQIVMVAKHHDGFCLWPTNATDYSVKSSFWRNGQGDVVGEVAQACRDYGLKFGFYLSPWDLHSPLYGTDDYNTFFKTQLQELLSWYGPISEVWFDGACGEGPSGKRQVYDWQGYYELVRQLQPDAVIAITGPDVRWVGNESGMGNETQWSMVVDSNYIRWYPTEVDVSIRPGWFWHAREDSLVKTSRQLVDIYYQSVGMNSGLLLNVPPDRRGLIPSPDRDSLQAMQEILDATFRTNLAADAVFPDGQANLQGIPDILDGDDQTWWTPGPHVTTATIRMDLTSNRTFNCLMLQENYRNGQRVEEFSLEVMINGEWKEVAHGTTIGHKRLLRFPAVTGRMVRFKILSSRGNPEIATFGLFLAK